MGSEAFSFEVKVCMHVNTQPVPADSTNAKSDILKVRERKTRTFRILENHANNVKTLSWVQFPLYQDGANSFT